MVKNSNYSGEVVKVDNLSLNGLRGPGIYFANLRVDGDEDIWDLNEKVFEKVKIMTSNVIFEDVNLDTSELGMFVIAFPFGLAIYGYGLNGEIDSVCSKYQDYEFRGDFEGVGDSEYEVPCPLEDKIKVQENDLWLKSKTIIDYYMAKRNSEINVVNSFPGKRFS